MLLVAVVAIAAHGRPLTTGSGGGGGLSPSFWDYTYTTLVIVGVTLLLGVVVVAASVRRVGRQRSSLGTLRSLAFFMLLVAFEAFVLRHLDLVHLGVHTPRTPQPTGIVHLKRPPPPGSGTRGAHFRWDEVAIILGLLLVVGAVAIVSARRSRRPGTPPEIAPEVLAAALDESLDDLRSDRDLRRAIVAAYARMERALGAAGIPRRPAEAPLEYLERALLTLDTSAEAVRRLTDLFEWARFSHHEPEASMRDDAVDALVAVRDELLASEQVPA
jgi:hypothetical protein